ncbi:hypothetical protein ACLB1T_06075 [Escherichia coli]
MLISTGVSSSQGTPARVSWRYGGANDARYGRTRGEVLSDGRREVASGAIRAGDHGGAQWYDAD